MSVDPGEGFRLLLKGEPIREDVTYYVKGKWHKMTTASNVGEPWNDVDFFPMRVPKEIADNTGIEVFTGGPFVAIDVHRAALAEIERLKAELDTRCDIWRLARDIAAEERDAAEKEVKRLKAQLDAVKQPQPDPEPEWFDLTPFGEHVWRPCDEAFLPSCGQWRTVYMACAVGASISEMRRVGYTQFRCLLKDAPPELVAKAKQTESPDDWMTQDRVPARPGIDERQWVQYDGTALGWVPVKKIGCWSGMKHGDVIHGDRLELRCRRKDLPPLPEQPKTETVVFYEVISATQSNRYLHFVETPVEGVHIPTGKTETREVVR